MIPALPQEVVSYVRKVFRSCNKAVCLRIARVPGVSEPTLDMTLIDTLASYATPEVVAPSWAVRVDTHFLGGRKHFYSWEIADIGLLIQVRLRGKLVARKVALLQSKRLYPVGTGIVEDSIDDYTIGFGRLMQSSETAKPIATANKYSFSANSKYQSLKAHDDQAQAIQGFEAENGMAVHYLLYNPWAIPTNITTPHQSPPKLSGTGTLSTRVIPAQGLLSSLSGKAPNYSPSLRDIDQVSRASGGGSYGWALEHFVADLVLGCKQGTLLENAKPDAVNNLFNRRSGPISAAIAVTIEQFE